MLTELKTFVVKCDGCGKIVKVTETEEQYAIPNNWKIEKAIKHNFDGYNINTNSMQNIIEEMINNTDKHYCEGCYAIKDIIE